mgnify:CR=1 FL=1
MHSIYYKAFNYLDNFKPAYLGIYFSLLFHLSILLIAIGLPDFFKPNKILIPKVIPIEILNISDVTSLTLTKESIDIDNKETKNVKQKKFNSSNNTEIQKVNLQEKPKKNLTNNDNSIVTEKIDSKKILQKNKQINKLNQDEVTKLDKVENLKIKKIKPKLKPKPIEKLESKSDIKIENKPKPVIEKDNKKKLIDKPKPILKPESDFNLATMLKDLRNEDISNINDNNNNEDNIADSDEKEEVEANVELSISEMDLVIQQLRGCFNPRAGTQIVGNEMVKIGAKIDRNAYVRKDTVQIIDTNISKSNPYYEAITESAVATLYNPLCSKLKLPLDKYESWKNLKITIDYIWIKN